MKKGEQSWTALHSDNNQYLIFDLDRMMMVTKIATQGRPLHDDYVLEFAVSYGSNGFDYADYKTSSGDIKVRIFLPLPSRNFSWTLLVLQ